MYETYGRYRFIVIGLKEYEITMKGFNEKHLAYVHENEIRPACKDTSVFDRNTPIGMISEYSIQEIQGRIYLKGFWETFILDDIYDYRSEKEKQEENARLLVESFKVK